MWYQESVFYQIYPLGFCGAPLENDGVPAHRIEKVKAWIPHFQKLRVGAIVFNPVFESDAHGYDTQDFTRIDTRLGTNENFAEVCQALHKAGIRVVLDAVFNHVGRGFWAFRDVQEKREASAYKDWFHIDFSRDSNYGDGFWYDGWEGHFELVRLNLQNYAVVEYLLNRVEEWIEWFGIDGLRLDVAYTLDHGFMRHLRAYVDGKKQDFYLLGEMLFGDYRSIVNAGMLNSATNYECYKGMYSSLNAANFFEIAYSYNRQYGPEDWTLYKGLSLMNFIDNHDVTRAASILSNPAHLPLLYALLFGMPGVPCLYYGSEWGAGGKKEHGSDAVLRPCFEAPVENEVFDWVCNLGKIRTENGALWLGGYRQVYLTGEQFVFERRSTDQRILVAINSSAEPHTAHFNAEAGQAIDLLTGTTIDFGGGLDMQPLWAGYLLMER